MSETRHLTMAAVRQLTGLTERQIRYYDEKGLVVARRTPGGHRLYTESDVERLRTVKSLLAQGLSLEAVRGRLGRQPPAESDASEPGQEPARPIHPSFDERGLEDVKIYFGSLRRRRRDSR